MSKSHRQSSSVSSQRPRATVAPWILLVDDEPLVRHLIDQVLSDQGWSVKLADGANMAFKLMDAAATPPAVLICDVMMPKIDGLELTRQMLVRVPTLNVIMISGHLADSAWWPADLGRIRLLKKPFLNAELVAAVREAIESQGAIA